MKSQESWIVELAALAASAPTVAELAPLEVAFEVSGTRCGVDLISGRITDGAAARCTLAATTEVFQQLVKGSLTLQKAHLTGLVQLSGEPESLLRLAFLLDAADSVRKRQEYRQFDAGTHV